MSTSPDQFPEEYLYSLNKPSPSPKKRRGWIVVAVSIAAGLILLLGLLVLPRPSLEAHPPETDTRETDQPSDAESDVGLLDTETEEAETVDKYGYYEGNEVWLSNGLPDLPVGEHGYEDRSFDFYYHGSGKLIHTVDSYRTEDAEAPATWVLAATELFGEQTLTYRESYRPASGLYRLYADESGYETYLFTEDGAFMEYDTPADGISAFTNGEQAIGVARDFLRFVGVEITEAYTCAVIDLSDAKYFVNAPKDNVGTMVLVTRNIGGMAGEGYMVCCGGSEDDPRVIYSQAVNPGMYEAFGYITAEQISHTRKRLYEAIGLLETPWGDPYRMNPNYQETLELSDGHLYLCVHVEPDVTDPNHYGDAEAGLCRMRVDP